MASNCARSVVKTTGLWNYVKLDVNVSNGYLVKRRHLAA